MLEIDTKQKNINKQIENINILLYENQLIKLNKDIDSNKIDDYKQELKDNKRIENKLIDEKFFNEELINKLDLIKNKESINNDNRIYQENNKKALINLNDLIKNEIQSKAKLVFRPVEDNRSLGELNNKLIELNEYLTDPDIYDVLRKEIC